MSYRNNNYGSRDENREMFDAICSQCNNPTQVPFKPDEERPVYCRDCYREIRNNRRRNNRYRN